jgi:hypothetical protein
LNTFDDDNDSGLFEEPRPRPPRDRARRPQRGAAPRRQGPPAGPNNSLRLAGLIVLAIAIVFGLVLSCSGGSKDSYKTYLTAMQPLAQRSAGVGAAFATDLSSPGLTLESFKADLATWIETEKDAYVDAQRLQPPGALQTEHVSALDVFYLREAALTNFAAHLDSAQQASETSFVAAGTLVGDAHYLTTSDDNWDTLFAARVAQVLKDQDVSGVQVPSSMLVTNPNIVNQGELRIVYQRLETPTKGGHVAGLHGSRLVSTSAVQSGTTTTLTTDQGQTVFCCGNLVVNVVLANSGNFPEVQVKVTLSVKVAGKSVYSHTTTVDQVAVGGEATAPFTDIQVPPSAFGHQDVISVFIHKVRGEAKVDNNSADYPVFFRLSAG